MIGAGFGRTGTLSLKGALEQLGLGRCYHMMEVLQNEGHPAVVRDQSVMARKMVLEDTFGGRFEDRAHAIDVFERHNAEVRRALPAERLLVYEVGDGWGPLCEFLERPVPDAPFPRVNSTEEFRARFDMAAGER